MKLFQVLSDFRTKLMQFASPSLAKSSSFPAGELNGENVPPAPRWLFVLPYLVGALPILLVYAQNQDRAPMASAIKLLAITAVAIAVLSFIARWIFVSRTRAILAVAVVVAMFFGYGRLFDVVVPPILRTSLASPTHVAKVAFWSWMLPVIYLIVFCSSIYYLRRCRNEPTSLAKFLTVFAALMLLFNVVRIVNQGIEQAKVAVGERPDMELLKKYQPRPAANTQDSKTPDIYYIILDAYARQDVLKNVHGHDNSAFLDFMRSRGFYVADKSISNYPFTYLSLASSLSMRYLQSELTIPEGTKRNAMPIFELMRQPLVARILQSKGYHHVHFPTSWVGSEINRFADENVSLYPSWLQNEFSQVILRTTALRCCQQSMAAMHLHTLDKLPDVANDPRPTFTFVHLICPHRPYVFKANGEIRETGQSLTGSDSVKFDRECYVEQLTYLSTRMQEVIDSILARSTVPPIIIVQADHGTCTLHGKSNKTAPRDMDALARERLPILNAYLVPESMRAKLYPEISPVNTFRILLSTCFGEDFPILPDHHHIGWYHSSFDLRDCTEMVVTRGAPSPDEVAEADRLNFPPRAKKPKALQPKSEIAAKPSQTKSVRK